MQLLTPRRDAKRIDQVRSGPKRVTSPMHSHAYLNQSINQSINLPLPSHPPHTPKHQNNKQHISLPPPPPTPTERERETQYKDPNLSTLSIPSQPRETTTPLHSTQGALLADRVRIIHCTNLIDPERALPCSSRCRSSASAFTLSFLLVSCFLPAPAPPPCPSPLLLALGVAVGALRSSSLW